MSKARKAKRSQFAYRPDVYWQTADYNANLFMIYRQHIQKLVMSRFHWINLPPTCDERFLEYTLMYQGVACIAFPKKMPGQFFSTQVAQMSPPNVYDNPSKWRSIGNNGWNFKCTPKNGVIIYDNRPRYPIMAMVDMWARELCDIRRTKQLNRMHQKVPFIIKCTPEQEQQAINLYKQLAGGEPAIITTTGIESIDIDVINTTVPFLGQDLTTESLNTWNEIFTMLGIENLSYKTERMVQDEVNKNDEPTDIIALDGLNCRREAADKLNERFAEYLPNGPIQVVWAQDNISENYNLIMNLESLAETGSKLTTTTPAAGPEDNSDDSDEDKGGNNDND